MLQVAKKKSRKLSQNVRKIKIRMFEKHILQVSFSKFRQMYNERFSLIRLTAGAALPYKERGA